MRSGRVALAAAVILSTASGASRAEAAALRVMALDQCADQYVLALQPDGDLRLSPRADDPDAFLRQQARGHVRVRPSLEQAVRFQPNVAVRYWGGDARLLARLEADGVQVVSIDDATDFEGVRANLRRVGQALGEPERAEALIRRMDAQTMPVRAERGEAIYMTSGGFTAGPGTMIDAILRAAGFRNATTTPGFGPVPVERVALSPPRRWVLGFFDLFRSDRRAAGRHPVMVRAIARGESRELPAAVLTCPAWFAGDAVARLADGA